MITSPSSRNGPTATLSVGGQIVFRKVSISRARRQPGRYASRGRVWRRGVHTASLSLALEEEKKHIVIEGRIFGHAEVVREQEDHLRPFDWRNEAWLP